jgi:aspartate aminotransferase
VYTRAEIKELLEWAAERKLWVIADEMYRRIHFGSGPAPSVYDLPDELLERVVLVTGVGATYAMTGWRVGIAVASPAVLEAMSGLQSHITAGASQVTQWAAAAALSDERLEAEVERMVEAFRRRRDTVVSFFRAQLPGVEFVEPMGAFYFFFRVDGVAAAAPRTGTAFCERLLAEQGVALVPGAAFGDDRWVRLSFAAADDELAKGLERLSRLVRTFESEETA